MANNSGIDGGRNITERLNRIRQAVPNEIEQALVAGALYVERDYKLNVSQAGLVDTGLWINTITHQEDNFGTDNPSVQVGSTIKDPSYPKMHEFGTSKFPATPTLGPAYAGNKDKILKALAKALRKGTGL